MSEEMRRKIEEYKNRMKKDTAYDCGMDDALKLVKYTLQELGAEATIDILNELMEVRNEDPIFEMSDYARGMNDVFWAMLPTAVNNLDDVDYDGDAKEEK